MAERYFQHTFPNGLTLLGEQMPAMQSVAMTLLMPAGASSDPVDRCGSATVLSDLVLRGAGTRDKKQFTDYLDLLGLQRSTSVGIFHTRFSCAALGPKVMEGMSAYADLVRRPHLPPDGFDAARDLAVQAMEGIEDEPARKLMVKLREWHMPSPFGRNPMGRLDDLELLTLESVKADYQRRYHASEMILAFAGNIEFESVKDRAEELFGDMASVEPTAVEVTPPPGRLHHEHHESEQTHIGIAWESVPETDPDYYSARLATEALGGGMSGRLFTEVREKRGLCYSVGASYSGLKGRGNILGYAGTSNERAQQTLDCFLDEVRRLAKGIRLDELDRAKTGLKSATIMQGESTSARAGAIAHDYFIRGRIRTLEEIKAAIDSITLDRVNHYLAEHCSGPFTIVTVGPKTLKVN